MWLYVVGILKPAVLSPEIDASVLVGYPFADKTTSAEGPRRPPPSATHQIYVGHGSTRSTPSITCLPPPPTRRTRPRLTSPSPPSALIAQADAKGAFNGLFLGLGAVALLVGAIGVANIMVICGA